MASSSPFLAHQIIIRGIERKEIFRNNKDKGGGEGGILLLGGKGARIWVDGLIEASWDDPARSGVCRKKRRAVC